MMCFPQDRSTFRRLIVKNNAKKRRIYETFIESVPLLKSLEVTFWFSFLRSFIFIHIFPEHVSLSVFIPLQANERMKIVDVLGAKQFSDGERIITQV